MDMSGAYARGLVEGVGHYIRENQAWELQIVDNINVSPSIPTWFAGWKGDGIIAKIDSPLVAKAVTACKAPTIDVCNSRMISTIPWIETDNEKISHMAAEHLIQRGFKNLAFCGEDHFNWSIRRRDHFAHNVRMAGCKCSCFELTRDPRDLRVPMEQIGHWLKQLPKPVGVMASHDALAQKILAACHFSGLAVPDEVAVIGVDNDPLFCELPTTPLSSVIPNTRASGYKAAALLDKMMHTGKIPLGPHVIPPLGVISRQSTDLLAVDDPHIKEAVKYIRENACSGVRVSDVARRASLSRRVLELRFKKLLGQTPREEILQVRLEQVKKLLRETKLPLYQIADSTGFKHIEYLSVVFKRETNVTPSYYRAEAQR